MGTILTFILDCAAETLARLLYVKQLGRTLLESVYVALLISWGIKWSPTGWSIKNFTLACYKLKHLTNPTFYLHLMEKCTQMKRLHTRGSIFQRVCLKLPRLLPNDLWKCDRSPWYSLLSFWSNFEQQTSLRTEQMCGASYRHSDLQLPIQCNPED